MKGIIGIGVDRMEEGEISTVTPAHTDQTEGRDSNPSELHDLKQLGDGSYLLRKCSPTSRGSHTKAEIKGLI